MSLTQKRLKELVKYDPDTGVFTWRSSRGGSAQPGGLAGTINGPDSPYRRVQIDGKKYFEHRLAWLYVYGCFPPGDTLHKNGDPTDNRVSNLTSVSRMYTIRNAKLQKNNTSGITGVTRCSRTGRWVAHIKINGSRLYLGTHERFDHAVMARLYAEREADWGKYGADSSAEKYARKKGWG